MPSFKLICCSVTTSPKVFIKFAIVRTKSDTQKTFRHIFALAQSITYGAKRIKIFTCVEVTDHSVWCHDIQRDDSGHNDAQDNDTEELHSA